MDDNKNNRLSKDDCTKIRNEIRDSIKSFASIFNVNNGQVKNKQTWQRIRTHLKIFNI